MNCLILLVDKDHARCQMKHINCPLTLESDGSQCDRVSLVARVERPLPAGVAGLAAAGVVVVVGTNDDPALQEDEGMGPQELKGLEVELSIVVPAIGVYVDRPVDWTAETGKQ